MLQESSSPAQGKEWNTRLCPLFSGEEEILKAYVSRALGKDEAWSETKGPDGRGAGEGGTIFLVVI